MRKRTALCSLICVVWCRTTGLACAEDVESLRQQITKTLSTITSIEVRYQKTSLPLSTKIPKKTSVAPWDVNEESPRRYLWAKQGSQELYEQEAWPVPRSKQFVRRKLSFNGRELFHFHFQPENPDIAHAVDVRNTPARDAFGNILSHLIGAHVWQSHLTLLELLHRPGVTYGGTEDVESHVCHKLIFGEYDTFVDTAYTLTIWVDPGFDYLPRKMENLTSRNKRTNMPLPPMGDRSVITEFFQVDDLALKRQRWFPKKINHYGDVEILEARLNPSFEPQHFTPLVPVGALVTHWDQIVPVPGTNRTRPKSEVAGGSDGLEIRKERSELSDKLRHDLEIEANRATSELRQFWYWTRALGISLGSVVVAVFVWKRSGRRWR